MTVLFLITYFSFDESTHRVSEVESERHESVEKSESSSSSFRVRDVRHVGVRREEEAGAAAGAIWTKFWNTFFCKNGKLRKFVFVTPNFWKALKNWALITPNLENKI